jgi:2-oxoglutarate dehydrogenase E2 component (dihydrolipoamide succinyltransferase)
MAVEIQVPSAGESVTEGTLARWLKKDGDMVRADEPVVELETEKATTEVAAPAAGRLVIAVPEGQTVRVGTVIGRIEEGAPAPSREKPDGRAGAQKAALAPAGKAAPPPTPKKTEEVPLSPAARRLAEDRGVDVHQVTGTGRGGRITKEDVLAHLDQGTAAPERPPAEEPPRPTRRLVAEPAGERETRQRMSSIRLRIAERLVSSQTATATLTTFNEADLSAVIELRGRYKDRFRDRHGVSLGFMSFFVKAAVEALRAFPIVNASIDGSDVVYHNYHDIGVAVSTEKGLMVPVLRAADRASFADIEKRIAELAQKARDGKITVTDLQGGTFTITNGGIFGSLLSTPLLNPPQSAILGMHAIQKRPVVVNDQVVVRPMMYLALSYDHRLIDGREAVQFLVRVKECVENPERLLLEV